MFAGFSQGKQVISTIQNVIGVIEGAEEPDRYAQNVLHQQKKSKLVFMSWEQ